MNAEATKSESAFPLVSLVVPVYNGASYLRESLDSLLSQTYPKVELIVVDDGSTDTTPEILAAYNGQLLALRQPVNQGIYASANHGIARARGAFVAVYHADDIYDPRIVEREVAFFAAHPAAGAVFCLDVLVDAENREYARLQLPERIKGRGLLPYPEVLDGLLRYKNRFLMCPGAMVRAEVYRDLGGYRPEQFRNTSDLEMWLRIAQHYPLGLLEEYLFRYRHFHGQSSRRYHHLRTTAENFFTIMDLYLLRGGRELVSPEALACYEGHRAEDTLRIGVSYYIRGDLTQARKALAGVRARTILGGRTLQRGRLLLLLGLFRIFTRLPRFAPLADYFLRRWFEQRRTPVS